MAQVPPVDCTRPCPLFGDSWGPRGSASVISKQVDITDVTVTRNLADSYAVCWQSSTLVGSAALQGVCSMETLVAKRQPEIAPDRIAQKIPRG
jgi:hypothetical protein